MVIQHNNIIQKKYKRLTIQVSLDQFSFCCFDTLHHEVILLKNIDLSNYSSSISIEKKLEKVFEEYPILLNSFDVIDVLYDNIMTTLVPKALFDDQKLGSYLQYNTKIFKSDFFAFDEIPNYDINTVYIPYMNINNFLIDQIGYFQYKHSSTILISTILDISKNKDEKQVYAHFRDHHFDLIVVQNQQLLLFNSFEYQTAEDFVYYLLFMAEQLQLNPESFKLIILGNCNEESSMFTLVYKYVRDVSLFDLDLIKIKHHLSKKDALKHYILLQS